jgi:hypothetical protein
MHAFMAQKEHKSVSYVLINCDLLLYTSMNKVTHTDILLSYVYDAV